MCSGGSVPKDNSAQLAAQEEQRRQDAIEQGRVAIDQAFTGFNDNYYNKASQDYLGYYNPQLDEQYTTAKDTLVKNLARQGLLNSGVGAKQLGDLTTTYERNKGLIGNQAADASQQLRSQVQSNKSNLYALNTGSADANSLATQAAAAAGGIVPGGYSPLGDVFASFLNSPATSIAAYNVASNPQKYVPGLFDSQGGSKVVN